MRRTPWTTALRSPGVEGESLDELSQAGADFPDPGRSPDGDWSGCERKGAGESAAARRRAD